MAVLDDRIGRRAKSKHISLTLVRNLAQFADPAAIAAIGVLACVLYIVLIVGGDITSSFLVAIVVGAVGTSVFCHWFDLYSDRFLFFKQIPVDRLIAAWAIVFAILLFIAFALKISSDFSRVWAVSWFAGGACALVGTRFLVRGWIMHHVRNGTLVERVVIFGAGDHGMRFAAQINKQGDPFTQVIGLIDEPSDARTPLQPGLQITRQFSNSYRSDTRRQSGPGFHSPTDQRDETYYRDYGAARGHPCARQPRLRCAGV